MVRGCGMQVLVACEESQTVCKEFRKRGHEAYSCDIEPCSGGRPEWHIQGDVTPLLKERWDAIIAFPPCTYLCSSGIHWTTRGLRDPRLTEDALKFVNQIMSARCDKIALENPVGCISTRIRKPDQYIQPYEYGEDASKKTCLWLKNLPPLNPTKFIEPKYACKCGYRFNLSLGKYGCPNCCGDSGAAKQVWGNQTASGQNKLGPSENRAKLRAKTYIGIAKAMSEQWG